MGTRLQCLGNDQKQSLNFRFSEEGGRREGMERNGRKGIIHTTVSVCVKIKVKTQKDKDGKESGRP